MIRARPIVTLVAVTLVSVVALLGVLRWQHPSTQRRWAVQMHLRPAEGSVVFAAKCGQCHSTGQSANGNAPQLRGTASISSLPALVTAMWNHAPQMWDLANVRKLPSSSLSYEEAAQLTAYLYLSGAGDNPGDPKRGREVFVRKGCSGCHSESSPHVFAACDAPLDCTQSLWNHAAAMHSRMEKARVVWPRFEADELRDLFAYTSRKPAPAPAIGDPEAGWQVFQRKGCISCHAVQSEGGSIAAELQPRIRAGATLSQFGAALLNHVPQMQSAVGDGGHSWPTFSNHELTDVAVFLYSLNYSEPTGSPSIGRSVFTWRGCNACHGADADGGSAPPLRGRGQTYTAVRLAADLWHHGGVMYSNARRTGQPWPILQESDIGHMLAFLNTPLD